MDICLQRILWKKKTVTEIFHNVLQVLLSTGAGGPWSKISVVTVGGSNIEP